MSRFYTLSHIPSSPYQVEEQFLGAENRFKQSLTIKADFVDGFLCLADLEMQRAKLAQGFHAPLPRCAPRG